MDIYKSIDTAVQKALEKGKNIIIYPFGKNGLLAKEILNWRYGIRESYIADNKLCIVNSEIKAVSEIENPNDYVWLVTSSNYEIHDQIVESLEHFVRKECIVDSFEGFLGKVWGMQSKENVYLESLVEDLYERGGIEKRVCPICESKIYGYLPSGYRRLMKDDCCPRCGTAKRHRMMWLYMKRNLTLWNKKILHFAPEKGIYDILKAEKEYYPVDLNPDVHGIRDVIDITNIPYESEYFDYVICSHVLEHIEDDKKAMEEIRRVLKNDGTAFIMVPLYDIENTFENWEFNTPVLREKYFDQCDHVRKYGKDFFKKLCNIFPYVEIVQCDLEFSAEEVEYYKLMKTEKLFICGKNTVRLTQ